MTRSLPTLLAAMLALSQSEETMTPPDEFVDMTTMPTKLPVITSKDIYYREPRRDNGHPLNPGKRRK